ncbi:MAG: hypothetical protein IJ303_05395 [Clostridia bacterium]|nr:hypothetical protein [Clostridia bacterium]
MEKDLKIISENLSLLSRRAEGCEKSRRHWLLELLKLFDNEGYVSQKDIAEKLRLLGVDKTDDLLCISRYLIENGKAELHPDFANVEQKLVFLKISCFESELSRRSLNHFVGGVNFETLYRDSFVELFEDVYGERADFCIVPIENTGSGKLLNFYSMIINYNLKIVDICDIEHQNDDLRTRFALLSRGPLNLDISKSVGGCMEICITTDEGENISKVLLAAELCRMKPRRIDSVPYTHLKNRFSYFIGFKCGPDALAEDFLVLLSLWGISYTPIGVFWEKDE